MIKHTWNICTLLALPHKHTGTLTDFCKISNVVPVIRGCAIIISLGLISHYLVICCPYHGADTTALGYQHLHRYHIHCTTSMVEMIKSILKISAYHRQNLKWKYMIPFVDYWIFLHKWRLWLLLWWCKNHASKLNKKWVLLFGVM